MIPPVEATGLGKRFGRSWGLRDCSVRIPPGRIAALVGPNGAGKTTFLHLAAGLLRPTAGEIRVLGRLPNPEPRFLLDRVGFIAQDAPLYTGFSVADTLHLGRALNVRFDADAAAKRLRDLGIPFERRIGKLSGGQRSQVALSVVLGKRPELLLLDEPVARLDPLARREFLQVLTEAVAEGGISVLLSSHLLSDLERICDYLIVIAGGRVQVAGDIETLLAAHHLLIGPRAEASGFLSGMEVVRTLHAERQTSAWVRGVLAPLPPGWRAEPLPLEELVIAYLASPSAVELPRPALEAAHA